VFEGAQLCVALHVGLPREDEDLELSGGWFG
jgi:hypothetical protein